MKMEGGLVEQRREIVGHVDNRVIRKKKVRRRSSSSTTTIPLKRKIPVCLALQELYSCCKKVFKGPGFVPPPQDVQSLCTILASAIIPLHNHPEMTVFSKLLLGTMHIKAYDWADPVAVENGEQPPPLRLAKLKANDVFTAPCNTSVLYPTSGGNIHAFTAITPCAVLDVLGPPYSKEDGRDCTYYKDTLYASSDGKLMDLRDDEDLYGWLEEIDVPEQSKMDGIEYLGPQIIETAN